jgi:putative endonuclease
MKKTLAHHIQIGRLGEDIVYRYLRQKGHQIVGRNYWQKWGEIDVISKHSGQLYFTEVKTVSRQPDPNSFQPEENVHPAKLKRLYRAIETYLMETGQIESDWQLDVICVYLDIGSKQARLKVISNIV